MVCYMIVNVIEIMLFQSLLWYYTFAILPIHKSSRERRYYKTDEFNGSSLGHFPVHKQFAEYECSVYCTMSNECFGFGIGNTDSKCEMFGSGSNSIIQKYAMSSYVNHYVFAADNTKCRSTFVKTSNVYNLEKLNCNLLGQDLSGNATLEQCLNLACSYAADGVNYSPQSLIGGTQHCYVYNCNGDFDGKLTPITDHSESYEVYTVAHTPSCKYKYKRIRVEDNDVSIACTQAGTDSGGTYSLDDCRQLACDTSSSVILYSPTTKNCTVKKLCDISDAANFVVDFGNGYDVYVANYDPNCWDKFVKTRDGDDNVDLQCQLQGSTAVDYKTLEECKQWACGNAANVVTYYFNSNTSPDKGTCYIRQCSELDYIAPGSNGPADIYVIP